MVGNELGRMHSQPSSFQFEYPYPPRSARLVGGRRCGRPRHYTLATKSAASDDHPNGSVGSGGASCSPNVKENENYTAHYYRNHTRQHNRAQKRQRRLLAGQHAQGSRMPNFASQTKKEGRNRHGPRM